MMINYISQVFSSEEEIFKYHFPDNPVVPGILPVAAFCKEMADKSVDFINLKNLSFYQFIRPDENIKYSQERNKISATVSEKLCFSFLLDYSGKDDKCESKINIFSSSLLSLPLREPEFWFLPKTVYINDISNSANCHLDIKLLQYESAYLQKFHYSPLLILVEAMGNLALVLQHQQQNILTESDYVFARFGELAFSPEIEHINSPVFIETKVTRFGSIMCWDAWAYSEGEKLLWINDAVSIKRKGNDVG
ncbi:hypothetical protein GEA64_05320 [Photorhabdus khanii]|uniref:ApeI dehydratase-like domain-containing protein n=1 Tax=Photorhabdus khanii TaxID=1004150 RepID=A0A7C9KED6_9GAMM|nr:hypothetical protein [Photorhabdus khanii]MQL47444.1 hypothetical protein [Photorhabdus khanii]